MKKLLKKLLRYSQVYRENEELKAQVIPLKQHTTAAYEELSRAWENVRYLTEENLKAKLFMTLSYKQKKEKADLKKELADLKNEQNNEAREEANLAWEVVQKMTDGKQDALETIKQLQVENAKLKEKLKTLENSDHVLSTEESI